MMQLQDDKWLSECVWTSNLEDVKAWDRNSISVKFIKISLLIQRGLINVPSENSFKKNFIAQIIKKTISVYTTFIDSISMIYSGNFRDIIIKKKNKAIVPETLKLFGMPLIHITTNLNIIQEILKKTELKADSFFSLSSVLPELSNLFPYKNFSSEEITFLSSEENKQIYRKLLIDSMNKKNEEQKYEIEKLCSDFVQTLATKSRISYINISEECRTLTTAIICKQFFGRDIGLDKSQVIAKAINKLTFFFSEKDSRRIVANIEEYRESAKQISDLVSDFYMNLSFKNNSIINQMREKGYNINMITVMIIMILGNAAEHLSEFLSYTLMQLAFNQHLQKKIGRKNDSIQKTIDESLRVFNSSFAIWRTLEEDSLLMIENVEKNEIYSYKIHAGEKIICASYPLSVCSNKFQQPFEFDPESNQEKKDLEADLYTFGGGEHICPAKQLSLAVTETILSKLSELDLFISVNFFEPIPLSGKYSTKLQHDLYGRVVNESLLDQW